AGLQGPAAYRTLEAHAHVVPDVAIRIADELKLGRRVHTDEPSRGNRQAGLFSHLAHNGVADRFADLNRAARQAPLSAVRALLEQEATTSVEDDGGDGGADTDGAGGVTLERDHSITLPDVVALRNVLQHVLGWSGSGVPGGSERIRRRRPR